MPIARFLVAAAAFVLVAPVSGLLFAGGTWLVVAFARYYVSLTVSDEVAKEMS